MRFKLNPFLRRQPVLEATGAHLTQHTDHRHYLHPIDHALPQSAPVRADELVWVATQIALHAAAGTLDEGNPHILDSEILHRARQWDQAVLQDANTRRRTAHSLRAEETQHLIRLREELADLRTLRAATQAENTHWRNQLLGTTAATALAEIDSHSSQPARSNGLDLADPGDTPTLAIATPVTNTDSTTEGEAR